LNVIKYKNKQKEWHTATKPLKEFPVHSRDVTTKLFLGGNNDVITELFLPRGSLVSGIPAGDGKLVYKLGKILMIIKVGKN
jgi:hypothetical protein